MLHHFHFFFPHSWLSSGYFQKVTLLKWSSDLLAIVHWTAEKKIYYTLAARSCTPYQFHFGASTVKDFWHKMDWCGPASTSILQPSVSVNPSLIHWFLLTVFHSFCLPPSMWRVHEPQTFTVCSCGCFYYLSFCHEPPGSESFSYISSAAVNISSFFLYQRLLIKRLMRKIPKSEATNTASKLCFQ